MKFKIFTWLVLFAFVAGTESFAQALRIPQNTNFSCLAGRKIGVTEIEIRWNAPGVKGREGKIWGTSVAPFGYEVLGFGSNVESPWRAGSDECTTVSFSTDVTINGKPLAAGKYALFMLLSPDSTTLIFNRNSRAWGSYFYDKTLDVLRVGTRQKKNQATLQERLMYNFNNQTDNSIEVSLDWERWSIPFTIAVDVKKTTLAHIRREMSSELGFDPPSLEFAASWCANNDLNLEEALNWINSATSPNLGGVRSFRALSIKSTILEKLGRKDEATSMMQAALDNATVQEIHSYGRQLLAQKKITEALAVFEKNHKKFNGVWPTNAGLMRAYSAQGDYKKALEYAKLALPQAPDEVNRKFLETAIKTLQDGKPVQ
ncbi:MAG: DUF2911 domain-containing protein [Spirosomataceae bacterium]